MLKQAMVLLLFVTSLWANQEEWSSLSFSVDVAADKLLLTADIPTGWRIVAHSPHDDFYAPFQATLTLDDGAPIELLYPEPQLLSIETLDDPELFWVDQIELRAPFTAAELPPTALLTLKLSYQPCTAEECLAPQNEVAILSLPTAPASQLEQQIEKPLILLLLFAFLGGLILNIMPCVLPVLSIKLFKLVEQSGHTRKQLAATGGAYTAGVVGSFALLAAAVIAVKRGGAHAGWGFQMQEPGFILFLAIVVTLFALNLFGLFEISLGGKTTTSISNATRRDGLIGSFAHGVFLALLSTPCSAPLLGSSVGWALTQSEPTIFAFYSAAALGLASPYLLVALFPALLRWLPRPGNWMVRVKEAMGFFLLLTAIWLLSVLTAFSSSLALWSGLYLVALAMIFWGHHHLLPNGGWNRPPAHRWAIRLLLLLIALLLFWKLPYPEFRTSTEQTQTSSLREAVQFSAVRVDSLNRAGQAVFVDLTADWCLTCKTNERLILSNPQIQKRFAEGRPHLMIGDFTRQSPEIAAELTRWKRAGVPLYILYPPQGEPTLFPEVLTVEMLLQAFDGK